MKNKFIGGKQKFVTFFQSSEFLISGEHILTNFHSYSWRNFMLTFLGEKYYILNLKLRAKIP